MAKKPQNKNEAPSLRTVVDGFIRERLAPKLEPLDKKIDALRKNLEEEVDFKKREELFQKQENLKAERQRLIQKFERKSWLESAARRASQIKLTTHAPKYAHPNAKGSSIYVADSSYSGDDALVGTHTLGAKRVDDVVGNAAALDVYKFLKLEHQGKTILKRVLACDPALAAALSDDLEQASGWMESFAAITGSDQPAASHKLAKQLYFPINDHDYHLLAPLFPASLVHAVYTHLHEAAFSEEVKQARKARKDGKPFARGYSEYPDLAVQVFGGSKPQNISQLNSERHGENWLLPSLPPFWRNKPVRPPLRVKTVFRWWFGGRPTVRRLTRVLGRFLASTHYNNVYIRRTRAELVDRLGDELLQFAAELQELPPGWSAGPECRLDQAEALWLDPRRTEQDKTFAAQRNQGEWQAEVASRFGDWLNRQLNYYQMKYNQPLMGEAEHNEWKRVIKKLLKDIREELAHA